MWIPPASSTYFSESLQPINLSYDSCFMRQLVCELGIVERDFLMHYPNFAYYFPIIGKLSYSDIAFHTKQLLLSYSIDVVFTLSHYIWHNSTIVGTYIWSVQKLRKGYLCRHMMTSSNGNIFRVIGHLCGEFIGHRCFDVFFDLHLNKRLSKQSRRRWFEMP